MVNARTDAFLKKDAVRRTRSAEAITRLQACEEAGARCVYPVGAPDAGGAAGPASTRCRVRSTSSPTRRTGSAAGSLEDLQVMGVHRVTFGPELMQRLAPDLTALVTPWR